MKVSRKGRMMRALAYCRACMGVGVLAVATATQAASLQVAPTSLQLEPRQNAEALWITNNGTAPVDVQARVFRWTQQEGRDALEPTTDLVVSPPMQSLAAGQQQLIRVVRRVPEPPATQAAYRVIVDEVPGLDPGREGMQFVLRYSLPVFLQPEQARGEGHQLQASVIPQDDGRMLLEVRNLGDRYAQLADLALGSPERPQIFQPGLVGYVLAGQTMRWPLDMPAARLAGATLSAKINGASQATPLPATPPAR